MLNIAKKNVAQRKAAAPAPLPTSTPAPEVEQVSAPTADIEEANVPAAPAAEPVDATEAKFEEGVPVPPRQREGASGAT
jgi:hypothetical protein